MLRFYGDPSGPNTHFYTALTIGRSGSTTDWVAHKQIDNYSDEDVLRKLEIANAGNPHTLHFEGMDFRVDANGNHDGSPTQPGTFRCNDQYFDYWHPTEKPWAPVYRLFNGESGTKLRADGSPIDGNHRYTTKRSIVEAMVKQGWIDEGIAWCERTFEQIR